MVVEQVLVRDTKSGKYYLPDCVKRYIDYKVNAELKSDVDYEKERALHEKAKREKAELLLAQMKGELHAAAKIEKVMTDMIVKAKTKLRGVSVKTAPSLLAQTEISVVEHIVAEAIDECLLELADYDPELFAGVELVVLNGGSDADDDEEA